MPRLATTFRPRAAPIAALVLGLGLAGCGGRTQTLAQVGAREITVRDVQLAAGRLSQGGGQADVQTALDVLVIRALMLEAAADLRRAGQLAGVDSVSEKDSDKRRHEVEDHQLDAVYSAEVLSRAVAPDSLAVRDEWGRRPRPRRLSAARVAVAAIADSDRAFGLRDIMVGSHGLADANQRLSAPLDVTERDLQFPIADPFWQRLERQLAVMRPHQVHGPLRYAGVGWLFVELLSNTVLPAPQVPSAAELESIRGELFDKACAARFAAFRESLATAIAPRIHTDRVKRVRLGPSGQPGVRIVAWTLALALILLVVLQRASRAGPRARTAGNVVLQVAVSGCLVLGTVRYLGNPGGAGWDFPNYHRAAREMRAGSSPYAPETLARDNWDPGTPFLYAPITLVFFRPLAALALERAGLVWFWLKLAAAVALVAVWWWAIAGRCPPAVFLAMMLFGFNGALLLDLRSGNVSGLEALLLWVGFVAFLDDRRWLSAGLIAVAAQFKLLPIVFLGLLAWPGPKRSARWTPVLAGLGLFLLLLALPNLIGAPWAQGYLHNLEKVRPYGEANPSAMGIIDTLLAGGGQEGGRGHLAQWLWAIYCIALLMLSADGVRRAWRRGDRMEWLVTLVMLFILLTPRPVIYGYALALVPALWMVMRLWPRAPEMATAVGVLAAQGFLLRGVARADFLPEGLPWFLNLEIANLPFVMALVLWFMFLRAPEPASAPAAPVR